MMRCYVVGRDHSVEETFQTRGYSVFTSFKTFVDESADLIVLTGGADISPHLYGEENTASHPNPARDEFEIEVYRIAKERNLPKLGICRGGQLMNVMNGGRMIQDIRGHTHGNHTVFDNVTKKHHKVISVHHQEMIPHETADIIARAHDGVIEVLFYHESKDLCFQSHPEWDKGANAYFFELVNRYLPEVYL